MTDSEELRVKVDANVKKLSYIEDKAQVETGIGVTLASLFGFTLLLSFFALWISAEYDNHAPFAVDLAFYSALVLWVIVTTVLGAALANIALGIRLRKQTSTLRDEVEALEKAEMEVQLKQAAMRHAAEEAERVRAAQDKYLADSIDYAAKYGQGKATGGIVKPVQRDSEGPRKPGGSPTQGKGSSPRKEL